MGSSACCSNSDENVARIDSEAIKKMDVSDETAPADKAVPAKPKMTITIIGARGIRNSDWLPGTGGKPDCYCVAKLAGKIVHKTEIITDSLAPQWVDEFDVFEYNDGDEIEFNVWDSDLIGQDYLGKVVLKPEQFMENGLNGDYLMEEAGENITAYLGLKIKLPSKVYPSEQVGGLEVTLEKGEANEYGITLDDQDKVNLHVCEIYEGIVQKYNDSVKDNMKVMQTDFITSVNGVEGNAEEMLKQFKEAKVTIKLRRAMNLAAILEKEDQTSKLGIIVPKPVRLNALVILTIEDGILRAYNEKCSRSFPGTGLSVSKAKWVQHSS